MKKVWIAALLILAALLTVAGGARLSRADAAHLSQTAHNCQNIQLSIQAQSSRGAAGHIAIVYRLHNLLGQAFTLAGYPGARLLDRNFASLPTAVHRGGSSVGTIPKRLVHVGAYGNAYFTLTYSDVPANNQPCKTAHYLMIIPPNDFLPIVTYAFTRGGTITPCGGNLNVSPVTAQPRYH